MAKIAIVYHSGYGHTEVIAKAVEDGCNASNTAKADLIKVSDIDQNWDKLKEADAIIFGCPTYMGSSSAPFKAFMDATSKIWMKMEWRNKIAAGFSNSGSLSGDKLITLTQLAVFAAQHGMIWVGSDIPSGAKQGDEALNRIGSWLGLMTQASNDAPEKSLPSSDIATAKAFGERIAAVTARWVRNGATT
jgi:multimeric flavodoxin WrbA